MKALGITCGVGSMLIGARTAGFDIVGNVDWRKYYHHRDPEGRNTFTENFKGTFFAEKYNQLSLETRDEIQGTTLAMGHPDCGNYSNLSNSSGGLKDRMLKPGDIPVFVEMVKQVKPRFFVQDNLPKSLIGYPIQKWREELPEYDLFPEWVSNWGYGNIQKFRKRFFMIGALKEERFVFKPSEFFADDRTVRNAIAGIAEDDFNHQPHTLEGRSSSGKGLVHDGYLSWKEFRDYMLGTMVEGGVLSYYKGEELKSHIGMMKGYKDKHSHVITGGGSFTSSAWTGLPYSIRERARIQGCPDDFIFYGTVIREDGSWAYTKNNKVLKQTAKFMPVQFCEFIAKQIAAHVKGEPFHASGMRVVPANEYVDQAKRWLCLQREYSDQLTACKNCWLRCKKY